MKHVGKMKSGRVNCAEVLAKYPVETYKVQKKKRSGAYRGKQSHHVIQNSHFQFPRGTTVESVCAAYDEGEAPCIPLSDGTNPKTEHGRVSKIQKADAKRYRARKVSPTFAEARQDAKNQLMAKPKPGLTAAEAECILKEVDKFFKKMCPKMGDLRKPGTRAAKPKAASRVGKRVRGR